jgi:quercetin 2,3-dioxygenase
MELVQFERDGSLIELKAETASRVLLLSGQSLEEPVVGQGPFVMNTRQEIQQAIADYQAGKMGTLTDQTEG